MRESDCGRLGASRAVVLVAMELSKSAWLLAAQGSPSGEAEPAGEWRCAAPTTELRWPKLGALMDGSEDDVLACMAFPAAVLFAPPSVSTAVTP